MPRQVVQLSDTRCSAAKYNPNGTGNKLADGRGLYLALTKSGTKSWRMKYIRPDGREDLLYIGDYPAISLKIARQRREEAKELLAKGIDPKSHQRAATARIQQEQTNTFEAVAREWHKAMSATWAKSTSRDMLSRIETYLFPRLGRRPVVELKPRELQESILVIEREGKLVIADRMRQATANILRYAVVQLGLLEVNPGADLKGSGVSRQTKHHPALPLSRLPELLERINNYQGNNLTRLALQLNMLVFVRSSELRFARWKEIDTNKALWTIPKERKPIKNVENSDRGAKKRADHLVPLSKQSILVLQELKGLNLNEAKPDDLVFPGERKFWRPMSENTLNKALHIMGFKGEMTGHGFRSMACSALIQSGVFQEDAVERQMSHQERNSVRLAYTHSAEFIQERRLMMQWWADYLDDNQLEHVTPWDHVDASAKRRHSSL